MDERIDIVVDLGIGSNSFTAYTMDLSKRYVEINSDYRSWSLVDKLLWLNLN